MKSLRIRVILSSLASYLALAILFSIGLNAYVEAQYYQRKIEKMIQTGSQIKMQLQLATSGSDIKQSLDYLGYQFEGRITLLDINQDRSLILYDNQRYQYNQGRIIREIKYGEHIAVVINTNYPVANSLWLGYLSQIDETKLAWLEIPIVTIDETLDVFRSFLWKGLLFGFFISLLISFWLAKSITNPIRRLNQLAAKIGKLEFDSSYQSKRQDEIGQLGSTLNEITHILENTISSLQTELSKKQQLEKLRKRFVAQVSHELQTPISIISSYAEAMQDGLVEKEEQSEYYETILEECQKMSNIVKELLDLSTLESGLLEYKKERIALKEFLEDLLRKQEWIMKSQNIFLHTDLIPCYIWGDKFRLEQALRNILSNNIKHAKANIWISLYTTNGIITLHIRNDGEEINPADLPYIWDSFYKGKSKHNGTGLGLAIASEILKAHQIQYEVYHDDTNKVTYELRFANNNLSNQGE